MAVFSFAAALVTFVTDFSYSIPGYSIIQSSNKTKIGKILIIRRILSWRIRVPEENLSIPNVTILSLYKSSHCNIPMVYLVL